MRFPPVSSSKNGGDHSAGQAAGSKSWVGTQQAAKSHPNTHQTAKYFLKIFSRTSK
ncbi:hypothetical protein [Rhizobium oryziradicis]|uniref:hypothetical protein n=1 Tax=Rhizobium oryziradicis TaxID=1867956 RepID=UPI0015881081|nr:hypothetical protein [Rhizobium oryziradicis]